ncbi:nucleotidyltransferase domain-containing protein [Variovorax sp. dw_954]|uniref:nucleotidyltransferase domain-containing protein n=1 Tax=Variovorax sp. dw_954 TaxID=2720078 RepID=UPI001BD5B713|nr:nucleotidyltransferase domain-containing protein [Variovorax sp. dw_954]
MVTSLRDLAVSLGPEAQGTQWHLFGSVDRDEAHATDIDLMILCKSDVQADTLRRAIDSDALALPLHLALLTFDEATEVDAVRMQCSRLIFP